MPAARSHLFVPANLAVVVCVNVDEARGQQIPLGIDDAAGFRWTATRGRDVDYFSGIGDDVATDFGCAGAIDDGGVLDD